MLRREGERHVFDWDKFRETIALAVRFLDNLIDVNNYPYPEIEKTTKANRKIGLGVMGFADMLALLKIPYDSAAALRLGEKIAKFLSDISHSASEQLGLERGSFPNFKESIWSERYSAMRNATTTVIAPTGSISIIAGVSSGIEPIFAVAFVRNILGGKRLLEINPVFERYAKEYGFYSTKLMLRIARTGSIQDISEVPKDIRRIFKTAHEIPYAQHIKVQASFQKYVDNSVSKTINLPAGASQKDVERAFKLAYKLGCKGITIYRYGSKPEQVLSFVAPKKYLLAHAEYAGGCPTGKCPMP
jgi:ribonucleoside-diphosphate reductase alpha chain